MTFSSSFWSFADAFFLEMQRVKPYLVRGWLPTKLNMGVHVVINETALEKIMTEERMDEYNMVSTLKTKRHVVMS